MKLACGEPVLIQVTLTKKETGIVERMFGNMAERVGHRLVTLEAEIHYRGPRRRPILYAGKTGWTYFLEELGRSADTKVHQRLFKKLCVAKRHPLERLAAGK